MVMLLYLQWFSQVDRGYEYEFIILEFTVCTPKTCMLDQLILMSEATELF